MSTIEAHPATQQLPQATRTLRGYALVLLAAVLWGSMGVFYKQLMGEHGLPAITVVFYRALLTSLMLFAALAVISLLRRPAAGRAPLHVARRDLAGFALFGLIGVAAFYVVYIHAVDQAGVGVAAVLMYTAPAWVTVISAVLLSERLSRRKGLALALAIGGAALVARIYHLEALSLNVAGVLLGLGAGLGYGIYILCNKVAVRRYPPWTVLAYALGFGALFMLPFQSGDVLVRALTDLDVVAWLLGVTLFPTLLAGLSFTLGLRDVPASNASIVATVEPVVAMMFGAALFSERLDWPQVLGGVLILGAVILLARAPVSPLASAEKAHHA